MSTSALDFWHFSLRLYRHPDLPDICIALQDNQGVDVNLLFFILFLAVGQRQLTTDTLRRMDDSIRDWRKQVVQPLRAIRRALKTGVAPLSPATAESLRKAILRDELQAERLQQEALEQRFPRETTGSVAAPLRAARANIDAYASLLGTPLPPQAVHTLLQALAAEFLRPQNP